MDVDRRQQRATTTGTVADTYETDRNAEQLTLECDMRDMRTHRLWATDLAATCVYVEA